MPTTKELLDKTVTAAANLFKKSAELDKLEASVARAEAREIAAQEAKTIGETEPEAET